ncbi:MAG: MBL fold metallo-hydrolase [Flavobacteriales bacterium]
MTFIRSITKTILAITLSCFAVDGFSQIEMIERPPTEGTEIRYYGTACLTIYRGGNVLLTDPFISNPTLAQAMFGKVETDVDYVEKYINPATFRKVKMVVSGHSHYDHLLDLPYLCKYIPETTPLIGNQTAKHILSYYQLKQPVVAVNDSLGNAESEGLWHYNADSTMRTMAFRSLHPPHFAGINLMNKRYTQDVVSEPVLMRDWQEGKTVAYLVDWLEEGEIDYRVYFSSSMARKPFGLFPEALLEEKAVDDLFISGALLSEFEDAPKPIIDLTKPKRIFLLHWENFFRSKEKPVKPINEKGLGKLIETIKKEYPGIEVIKPVPLNYY